MRGCLLGGCGGPPECEHRWRGFLRLGIIDGVGERGEEEGQGIHLLVPSGFLFLPVQSSQVKTLLRSWIVFPALPAALTRSQARVKWCCLGTGKWHCSAVSDNASHGVCISDSSGVGPRAQPGSGRVVAGWTKWPGGWFKVPPMKGRGGEGPCAWQQP